MINFAKCAAGLAFLSLIAGCASHTIRASEFEPVGNAGQAIKHDTMSIAGRSGLSSDGTGYPAVECRGGDLAEVEFRRGFGQTVVTLLTLGIVSPASIYFYCEKQDVPPPCDCESGDEL